MNIFKNVMLTITLAVLFGSCKKENTDTTGVSSVAIINASPTLATYNTYIDGTKIIAGALPFGGAIPYVQVTAGSHTLKFTAETDPTTLLSKTITVEGNNAYSFFMINRNEDMDGLLISDNSTSSSTEKAFIRFVNLSPDAPALDFLLSNATQNLVTNKSYKEASGFAEIDPGTYSFDVKNDAGGVVMNTLGNSVLEAGKYYTFMSIGLVTPNDVEESFKLQVYTHK